MRRPTTTPRTRNLGSGFVLESAHPGVGEPDWKEAHRDLQAEVIRHIADLVRLGLPDGVTIKGYHRELVDREQVVEIVMRLRAAADRHTHVKRGRR